MGRQIVLAVLGVLASIAIASTAWNLGAGEHVFWGLPVGVGLAIIAFAAWWFPKTIVALFQQPENSSSIERTHRQISFAQSFIPVIAAILIFAAGWVFGR